MEVNNIASSTAHVVSAGDTAWVLICACLVMIMTPTLGFFYSGLVRYKNMLSILIQCYLIFAAVGIIWALFGYSLAFGKDKGGFYGDFEFAGLHDVGSTPFEDAPTVPHIAFFFFQLCACCITPALIVGGVAERFNLWTSVIFSCVWVILVYCPICHWVFHPEGWLKDMGAIDFAGGMVVHMSAGYSALILALLSGKRSSNGPTNGQDNIGYSILGAAFLWFGWFGYNGGAAFSAGSTAGYAIVSTNLSASAAGLSWALIDYLFMKRVSALGIATGTVCGLIAMTPGCGFCPVYSSFIIGFLGGAFSNLFVKLKEKLHFVDDTLDVFGCHGICGTWGVFAIGFFASSTDGPGSKDGVFYGKANLLGYQVIGILAVAAWSCAVTFVLGFLMKLVGLLRVSEEAEEAGLDMFSHEEVIYYLPSSTTKTTTV